MDTRVAEVADGIFQLTTHVEEIDLGFNQYLVTGDEPLLFHTGMRGLFPLVAEAVGRVVPATSVRWIGFGHLEADECGAMNEWLTAAPDATPFQGQIGCMLSLGDMTDRPPRALGDGETLDIGGHVLRWIDTPHVPHGWDAGVLYDETTRTLFCGDLFTAFGAYPACTTGDLAAPAIEAEQAESYSSWSRVPDSATRIRQLAGLDIATLAPMHAPAYSGPDAARMLEALGADIGGYLHGS
jgi:flavorubredoxin